MSSVPSPPPPPPPPPPLPPTCGFEPNSYEWDTDEDGELGFPDIDEEEPKNESPMDDESGGAWN